MGVTSNYVHVQGGYATLEELLLIEASRLCLQTILSHRMSLLPDEDIRHNRHSTCASKYLSKRLQRQKRVMVR